MVKINKILHPTDFSSNSEAALKYACALAEKFEADLHIIHVALGSDQFVAYSIGEYLPESYRENERKAVEKRLAGTPAKALGTPRSVVREIVEGTPFLETIRYVRDNGIDMVVMGTHGHTGIKHLMMGSVAENVVRKCPAPVLTVHPEGHKFVMP